MIRQDAIFDRTEQRRDDPEQGQSAKEQRHGLEDEARHRNQSGDTFSQLQALRDHRLVVAVGQLAAEAGQDEKGQDEHRARQSDQGFRIWP